MNSSDENLSKLYNEIGDLSNDFRNQNLYRFILKRVIGEIILDVGCGAGHFLALAQKQGYKTTGLEESSQLIELSHKLYGDLKIQKGSVETFDFGKEKYDSIVMIDVLEHIQNDQQILIKLHNALKKEGRIIILVPAYQFLYGKRDLSIGHFRRYNSSNLTNILKENKFVIREVRYWNMLGVVPYFVAERILKRKLNTAFREKKNKGVLSKSLRKVLFQWFSRIENPLSFGFGLSVLAVAEKNK